MITIGSVDGFRCAICGEVSCFRGDTGAGMPMAAATFDARPMWTLLPLELELSIAVGVTTESDDIVIDGSASCRGDADEGVGKLVLLSRNLSRGCRSIASEVATAGAVAVCGKVPSAGWDLGAVAGGAGRLPGRGAPAGERGQVA